VVKPAIPTAHPDKLLIRRDPARRMKRASRFVQREAFESKIVQVSDPLSV
jgi:hypothetical protein